jgi:16S rRNA (cytosine1402-N4)-methyltransferase
LTAEQTISNGQGTISAHKTVIRGDGVQAKNKNTKIKTKYKKGEEFARPMTHRPVRRIQSPKRAMHQETTIHTPVLLEAVLRLADPLAGESYLDVTAGYGGHARAILERTTAPAKAVLVDRDMAAIEALRPFEADGAKLLRSDFLSASRRLAADGAQFDIILADLGVSSLHLDMAERGFSFAANGPLDMRMDERGELTADTVVNTWREPDIEDILKRYGEEWSAKAVARAIIEHRPIHDTATLADIVKRALPGRAGKIHPATKTFQALRIAVNDELGQLEAALPVWLELLAPGGRLLVISFHSLEDRLVKQAFADVSGRGYDAEFQLLAKHPITADETELVSNPRSRSAKLRGVVNIKNKKKGE